MNSNLLKIHGTDYKKMTVMLLEKASLSSIIGDKNKKIAIKPNLVNPTPAELGATTHPQVVEGIIEYLLANEFSDITVMEGSWVGGKTSEAADICGYTKLCAKYNIPFIDAQREKYTEIDCAGLGINICNCALNVDFMINVPVIKGHCQTNITCALKNMKGLIPNTEKRHFHAMGLHKPIAHLAKGLRQDFIVVDHICGDLTFEDGGNPVYTNSIMCGFDPVLVDTYVCKLMGYELSDVEYIKFSSELGCGSTDITSATVLEAVYSPKSDTIWEEITALDSISRESFDSHEKTISVKDMVTEVDSCSACYGTLIPVLDRLKDEGLIDKLPDKICIGQGFKNQSGKIGIGSCTSCFEKSLKGCPPSEDEMYNFLLDIISNK